MDNTASGNSANEQTAQPEAEVLAPRSSEGGGGAEAEKSAPLPVDPKNGAPVHRRMYRPSHRATFIGLAAVAAILLVNAVIIGLVIKSQSKDAGQAQGQVTVSQDALDHLGVNSDSAGDAGIQLTVTPNTKFKGRVEVGGDISVAGQFKLNSKFSAADANLAQLEAGNTTLNQLNVSGDSTVSNLNLRNNLLVTGTSRLQGAVTISQLLTVANSVNVSGNLSVASAISASSISATNITSIGTLTIGGHVITAGNAPVETAHGSSAVLGSNGTVSLSGNDAAGTVAFNVGVGASTGGLVISVAFHTPYTTTPHVVVTPIGAPTGFYITRNSAGFSVFITSALSPGGYAFDYIVEQ